MTSEQPDSPLWTPKSHEEPSIFTPESLLHQARRQKNLRDTSVPDACVLDPDGDLVRYLLENDQAEQDPTWPGYHTDLYRFEHEGEIYGIIGHAVGAPFAVLVAEQLFASGCEFLVSITSSGQIQQPDDPPYFVLIERALRDEGTSFHYRPPSKYANLDPTLCDQVTEACNQLPLQVHTGATWTTDAPFRETKTAIQQAQSEGILAVEMEAAALYTFATVREQPVVCFAHVTNQMGHAEEDFEKGGERGNQDALDVITATRAAWKAS